MTRLGECGLRALIHRDDPSRGILWMYHGESGSFYRAEGKATMTRPRVQVFPENTLSPDRVARDLEEARGRGFQDDGAYQAERMIPKILSAGSWPDFDQRVSQIDVQLTPSMLEPMETLGAFIRGYGGNDTLIFHIQHEIGQHWLKRHIHSVEAATTSVTVDPARTFGMGVMAWLYFRGGIEEQSPFPPRDAPGFRIYPELEEIGKWPAASEVMRQNAAPIF